VKGDKRSLGLDAQLSWRRHRAGDRHVDDAMGWTAGVAPEEGDPFDSEWARATTNVMMNGFLV